MSRDDVRAIVSEAAGAHEGSRFSPAFLLVEWEQVVDAWQLDSWEAYRDVARLGRKTRLSEAQRKTLWPIFARAREALAVRGLMTWPAVFQHVSNVFGASLGPYDAVVVDETQDTSITQLRFLVALAGGRANALFFAGDLGQRIF